MAEAARRAAFVHSPTWIMAKRQTAGRGRRGRAWSDPKGNLAATLIFKPAATPVDGAKRSFLAALALYEALAVFVDRTRLGLKWPNDVLLDGGKIAGILLESSGSGGRLDWLSVGIGVNLVNAPEAEAGAAFAPVSLAQATGTRVTSQEFLTVLADTYATQEDKLGYFGFERIREDWLRHAVKLGETITARTTLEEITGIFETIDIEGNLILMTGRGPVTVTAAEVYF